MQNYDLFLILSHNLSETEVPVKVGKIKDFLSSLGAQSLISSDLGRQKLAYAIDQNKTGYLSNIFFSLEQNQVDAVKKNLTLDTEVARFMLTLKKNVVVPLQATPITSVFEKTPFTHAKVERSFHTATPVETNVPVAEKTEKAEKVEKTEKTEKKDKEMDLADINKKIDEILQQDNFIV
ncbi:MAG: 30S ribosomal protein S6 [Candidatus Magasanikbacteria bacterium GW2011_GWC2_40_17]|uniref:Small ribosomal subunit protein bS6 n=1 Tax=Candidatus Magasanikbacteria bacterium GW2011_GWA2_42_32 TaxID=1619039 RepID=A0A0G1D322_9BACT|nr:MAG: 30S ribosomal protein S6 [Candidatus Magasanikbacteria bacterium GW2011_GWC2_40_17]KKS56393.1 MAG: 30S ribosomal protein S6 [Candidatus Magasanikbacteria bacterium GW2011_GWA2_42_32]OGH85112.1 MAG: 30S ribosomal protein S6 [Candidatus Magasanikbacteria bacterium RIFOXYB2_FULL_38_10]